jgi:hypothetical protein
MSELANGYVIGRQCNIDNQRNLKGRHLNKRQKNKKQNKITIDSNTKFIHVGFVQVGLFLLALSISGACKHRRKDKASTDCMNLLR